MFPHVVTGLFFISEIVIPNIIFSVFTAKLFSFLSRKNPKQSIYYSKNQNEKPYPCAKNSRLATAACCV